MKHDGSHMGVQGEMGALSTPFYRVVPDRFHDSQSTESSEGAQREIPFE